MLLKPSFYSKQIESILKDTQNGFFFSRFKIGFYKKGLVWDYKKKIIRYRLDFCSIPSKKTQPKIASKNQGSQDFTERQEKWSLRLDLAMKTCCLTNVAV